MEEQEFQKEKIIEELKNKRINYLNIPREFDSDLDIAKIEREFGWREILNRGYDIITDSFFVEEQMLTLGIKNKFDSFDEYYKFVEGKIYENACYYQYSFSSEQIKKYKIDMIKLNFSSLIDTTIENDSLDNELEVLKNKYKDKEIQKEKNKLWIKKVQECKNFREYKKVMTNFEKSKYFDYSFKDVLFYFFVKDQSKKSLKILIDSINNYEDAISVKKMFLYYSSEDVMKLINNNGKSKTEKVVQKRIKKLKNYINNINNNNYSYDVECEFDTNTNYYIVYKSYLIEGEKWPIETKKYFDNIKELIVYLKGDLSNCDLSKAIITKEEIKNCKVNEKTILPIDFFKPTYSVNKYYKSGNFFVVQEWKDQNDNVLLKKDNRFKYFFDFVHYLQNDLSNADLIFCDGLLNLRETDSINLENAHIRSEIMEKLGIKYKRIETLNDIVSFERTIDNEKETQLVLNNTRELLSPIEEFYNHINRISYVSDIHLMHRLEEAKSQYDVEFIIRDIVENILNNCGSILLIGGDISSDYRVYKVFIEELAKTIKQKRINTKVVLVLGNHELWWFKDYKLNDIKEEYKTFITNNNMFLIHNNLIYIENEEIKELSEEEILKLSLKDIREKLRRARLIIAGGNGFSGLNKDFNANQNIYRTVLNLKEEKEESKRFEKIYDKLTNCISDKHVIILTHTPKNDWSKSEEYVKNWVYVSGHTHRNFFYDDGEYRIYSDNQLGYHYKKAFLKHFYMENDYDLFSDYKDGIYKINKEEYNDFYRGINITMNYNREGEIIMLKRSGYYCFLKQSENGLAILNGGALKLLDINDIKYYYDNMEAQINLYKEPLNRYKEYQEKIASLVKEIGGRGTIHGSIVDIDFFNHIFVNPFDGTIFGYYATNIIDKYLYPNIPSLLKANCPKLYDNYTRKLEGSTTNALIVKGQSTEIIEKPEYYPDTDMYKASREIKKIQKLNSGVLTVWYTKKNRRLSEKY